MFIYTTKKSNVCSLACALSNLILSFCFKSCLSVLLTLICRLSLYYYRAFAPVILPWHTLLLYTAWFYSPVNSNFFYDGILSERLSLTTLLENCTCHRSLLKSLLAFVSWNLSASIDSKCIFYYITIYLPSYPKGNLRSMKADFIFVHCYNDST